MLGSMRLFWVLKSISKTMWSDDAPYVYKIVYQKIELQFLKALTIVLPANANILATKN